MNNYQYLNKLQTTAGLHILERERWIPDGNIGNHDSLISYVFSKKFLKKSYDGEWKYTNDFVLSQKDNIMSIFRISNYKDFKIEIMDMLMMNAVVDCWKQYKQVYKFDNDFINYLIETDNAKIPIRFFHDLPYKTFYLDISDCNTFPDFFGCMVNVSFDETFNAIPNITMLRYAKQDSCEEELIFSGYFSYEDFIKYGMIELKEGTDLNSSNISLDDIYINFNKHRVNPNIERSINVITEMEGATSFHETNIQEFVMFIMQSILYLGSYKPDIRPRHKSTNTSRCRSHVNSERVDSINSIESIQQFDVGVRYGNTIRAYTKSNKKNRHSDNKSMSHRKPTCSHIRRAHWHTYHVG